MLAEKTDRLISDDIQINSDPTGIKSFEIDKEINENKSNIIFGEGKFLKMEKNFFYRM